MSISFDAASISPSSGFSSGTSLSWNHTVGAGATLMTITILGLSGTSPTALTVGGVSILSNLVQSVSHTVGNGSQDFMYYMNNPSSGSQTITVTFSDSQGILAGKALTHFGTDTTSAVIDSSSTAVVSSPSSAGSLALTTTVVAANCWLIGFAINSDGGTGSLSSGSIRIGALATDGVMFDSNGTVGTGSQTITVTSTVGSGRWGGMIASIKPAATIVPSGFFFAASR